MMLYGVFLHLYDVPFSVVTEGSESLIWPTVWSPAESIVESLRPVGHLFSSYQEIDLHPPSTAHFHAGYPMQDILPLIIYKRG